VGGEFLKSGIFLCIPDPNQSTAINFVDVNALYCRLAGKVVVEERNVLHHVKRGGLSRRGNVRENMCREKCVRTYVSNAHA